MTASDKFGVEATVGVLSRLMLAVVALGYDVIREVTSVERHVSDPFRFPEPVATIWYRALTADTNEDAPPSPVDVPHAKRATWYEQRRPSPPFDHTATIVRLVDRLSGRPNDAHATADAAEGARRAAATTLGAGRSLLIRASAFMDRVADMLMTIARDKDEAAKFDTDHLLRLHSDATDTSELLLDCAETDRWDLLEPADSSPTARRRTTASADTGAGDPYKPGITVFGPASTAGIRGSVPAWADWVDVRLCDARGERVMIIEAKGFLDVAEGSPDDMYVCCTVTELDAQPPGFRFGSSAPSTAVHLSWSWFGPLAPTLLSHYGYRGGDSTAFAKYRLIAQLDTLRDDRVRVVQAPVPYTAYTVRDAALAIHPVALHTFVAVLGHVALDPHPTAAHVVRRFCEFESDAQLFSAFGGDQFCVEERAAARAEPDRAQDGRVDGPARLR